MHAALVWLAGLWAGLAILAAAPTGIGKAAQEEKAMQADPIVAFARDFSDDDPDVVAMVERFVVDPPIDPEVLGFYGSEKLPPRARAFQAAVTLLENKGKLIPSEDKYSHEFVRYLAQEGHVVLADLPPAARRVFELLDSMAGQSAASQRDLEEIYANYAPATQALEDYLAQRGKVLLSVDPTEGDTMFFALVSPSVAERWRDRALGEWPKYESGIRSPMWDRYWANLTYAVPALDDPKLPGVPPGTRAQVKDLPAAD